MELEPPEVPIMLGVRENKIKKEGFFKKLFSKKKTAEIDSDKEKNSIALQDISIPQMPRERQEQDYSFTNTDSQANAFPELPSLDSYGVNKTTLGKSRGKKSKTSQTSAYQQYDVRKTFDWTEPVNSQENIILDNNRYNSDIREMSEKADQQILKQKEIVKNDTLLTEHEDVTNLPSELPTIPDTTSEINNVLEAKDLLSNMPIAQSENSDYVDAQNLMPTINMEESQEFEKIEKEHLKLRAKMEKMVQQTGVETKKKDFIELLKQYDDKIEKKIEEKQMQLSRKRNQIDKLNSSLSKKEKELNKLHTYLKDMQKKLNEKQSKINSIISVTVNKQLSKRLAKEKKLLKSELLKTMSLNKKLQKNLGILERDRTEFEKKKTQIMTEERERMTATQEIYDKKLFELDTERKIFEDKKQKAMSLLNKADEIAKDLAQLENVKNFIQKNKKTLRRDIDEDKDLRISIKKAENKLYKEKENLDNMIFSKYIESKLSSIRPKSMIKTEMARDDFDIKVETQQIYELMTECKNKLLQKDISNAKKIYTSIKKLYEKTKFDKIEKDMVYNSIRALYNEIQLTIVENQLAYK